MPFDSSFSKILGGRQDQILLLMEYAVANPKFREAYELCKGLSSVGPAPATSSPPQPSTPGRVYLIRSGQHYKIGKTDQPGRRYREVQLLVPGELEEIHVLETDDPSGIELYWHRRFANKRTKGEWFELTAADVAAFKRRGNFM